MNGAHQDRCITWQHPNWPCSCKPIGRPVKGRADRWANTPPPRTPFVPHPIYDRQTPRNSWLNSGAVRFMVAGPLALLGFIFGGGIGIATGGIGIPAAPILAVLGWVAGVSIVRELRSAFGATVYKPDIEQPRKPSKALKYLIAGPLAALGFFFGSGIGIVTAGIGFAATIPLMILGWSAGASIAREIEGARQRA